MNKKLVFLFLFFFEKASLSVYVVRRRKDPPLFSLCCNSLRVIAQIHPTPIQLFSASLLVFRLDCVIAQTMPNWALKSCCKHDQVMFLATIGVFTVVILAVCFLYFAVDFYLTLFVSG